MTRDHARSEAFDRIAEGDADQSEGSAPLGYQGYEQWKSWTRRFTYTADEAAYFAGEVAGLEIAEADVLEIGFGAGSFLSWARDQGARIAGIEILPSLIEAAEREGVALLPHDFEREVTLYAAQFDTIVAFDVFEHFSMDDIRLKLDGCEMLLKRGGHLMLRFPNAQSPFGLAPQHGDLTHKSYLSRGVFEQLIQGSTWRVTRYNAAYPARGGRLGRGMASALRHALQRLVGFALNFIYAQRISWNPVVVLVLQKAPNG